MLHLTCADIFFCFECIDMSGLPNNTYSSPGVSFYAVAGGGGGGGSLQSPVTVIPDNLENARINVNAGVGGSALITVIGSATDSGVIGINGFGTAYTVGVTAAAGAAPSEPSFSIGATLEPNVAFLYDPGTHQLSLGDADANGVISIRNGIGISDPDGVGNQLGISPVSATESSIVQAVASGGSVNIGSSQAFSDTLVVSDVTIPSPATANYVQINGASGQVPLVIAGAQGVGGGCGIFPNSAAGISSSLNLGASLLTAGAVKIQQSANVAFVDVGGNGGQSVRLQGSTAGASTQSALISSDAGAGGQLSLGGSSGSANNILISDTTAIFDQQIVQQVAGTVTYLPAIALPNATRGAGTSTFSIATYATGLWMLMVRVANSNITDGPTVNNLFSTLLYIQQLSTPGTSVVVGGGSAGNGNLFSTPIVTGALGADSIQITVGAGAGNTYFNVKMWPMAGVLPGFDS